MLYFSSCVSTKVFNDLESRYSEMKIQRYKLQNSQDSLQQSWDRLNNNWNKTKSYLNRSRDSVILGLGEIKILKEEFALLMENSNFKIQKSISKSTQVRTVLRYVLHRYIVL